MPYGKATAWKRFLGCLIFVSVGADVKKRGESELQGWNAKVEELLDGPWCLTRSVGFKKCLLLVTDLIV